MVLYISLSFQAKRKLELELDVANEGFKTPAKTYKKHSKSDASPKGGYYCTLSCQV